MKGDGLHINLGRCRLHIADDPAGLRKIIDKLIKLTGLQRLGKGDVQVGASYLPGVSVVQVIETSHIAIHGFTINNCYQITIVSCKPFEGKKVVSYVAKTFKPSKMASHKFKVDTFYPVTKAKSSA
jgi:S-adenosylmethionine/arginine decarboxylase-like enzyme